MKKFLLLVSFFIFFKFGITQNLVPNSSFENTYLITVGPPCDSAIICNSWYSPTNGSPDYFNKRNNFCGSSVPLNYMGYQEPRTGFAYWGCNTIVITPPSDSAYYNWREYIQAKLLDSLHTGIRYYVSFYVCLADSAPYACNGIGAYFSDTAVYDTLNGYQHLLPGGNAQINATGIISDKVNWTLISGSFIAHGGEQYITIGNFKSDSLTDTLKVCSCYNNYVPFSYYYVDDICVSTDSNYCQTWEGVKEIKNNESNIKVYPNPATDNLTINVSATLNTPAIIEITNIQGQVIIQQTTNFKTTNIVVSALAKGMYFVKVRTGKGMAVKKFIKE